MPTPEARRRRRRIIWIVVAVIPSLAFVLLAWTVVDARNSASDAAQAANDATSATGDLAAILNRRAPTLEYLGCHDRAADAVDLAYNDLVNALLDADAAEKTGDPEAIAKAYQTAVAVRLAYNAASDRLEASTDPNAPPLPKGKTIDDGAYRCPALPIP